MSTIEESVPPNNEASSNININEDPAAAAASDNNAANNNNDAQPINQQPQRGIVSSENSVASSSTNTKINAAIATAAPSEEDKAPASTAEADCKSTNTAANNNALLLQMTSPPHYPVAEFLFQLTKMLTDDNKEFIEWKRSSIFVHDPPGLEKQILPKYFRHSNYSSFQRQMNYFGFRKIAGKGKMAACSYVNENATEDISSLLYIKRKKTGVSSSAAKLLAQANKLNRGLNPQAQANMNQMMMMQNAAAMQNQMMMNSNGMMGMNPMAFMQQQQLGMGLNGLQGMGGGFQMNMGGPAGMNGLSMMSQGAPGAAASKNQILAQLQQAHASASSGLNPNSAGMAQNTLKNNFGMFPTGGAGTAPILTNDQGNIYSAGNGQWNTTNGQAAPNGNQALLMQQAAAMGGLGSFPQGATNADKGLDSSNFRSFINNQISLFSDGAQAPTAAAAAGPAGTPAAGMGITSPQGMSNLPQGLSYEQFFGMANGAGGATGGADASYFPRNV